MNEDERFLQYYVGRGGPTLHGRPERNNSTAAALALFLAASCCWGQAPASAPARREPRPPSSAPQEPRPPAPADAKAELDAQRAIGKACYENAETPPQFEPAAAAFRRCIELSPASAADRFNLGLTLMRAEQYEEALAALQEARRLQPDLTAASYITGIVQKRLGQIEEALQNLKAVTSRNPDCAGAYYNLGVCYKQLEKYEDAVTALKRAVELAPKHPSYHYQIMSVYRQLGDVENVKRHKETFDLIKDSIDESEKTAEALERSEYSYIIEPPRQTNDLPPNPGAKVRFVDVTEEAGLSEPPTQAGGRARAMLPIAGARIPSRTHLRGNPFPRVSVPDAARAMRSEAHTPSAPPWRGCRNTWNGNCVPKVMRGAIAVTFDSSLKTRRFSKYFDSLWRDGALMEEATAASVVPVPSPAASVRNDTPAHPPEPTRASAPPAPPTAPRRQDDYKAADAHAEYAASVGGNVALGDYDSDGDLDVYIVQSATSGQGSANLLLRNEGDWRFVDVTADFGVGLAARGMSAAFGDYDNDGNQDLYVANDGPNVLYRKLGHGAYEVRGLGGETPHGIARLKLDAALPEQFEVETEMNSVSGDSQVQNGYLVFAYRGPDDFKYAGADISGGGWVIGHFDGEWKTDARLAEGLNAGQAYRLRLRVEGPRATLLAVQSGEFVEKAAHDFRKPLVVGGLGLAAVEAVTRFDDLLVRGGDPANPQPLYAEDFKDGAADRLEPLSGEWKVVDWQYEDVSRRARVAEPLFGRRAIFIDYDHDGDLDLFVVNDVDLSTPPEKEEFSLPDDFPGEVNTLLRNNGDGTFTDQTDEANLLLDCSQSRDVLLADFDGDTDTDMFVVNANAPSLLLVNQRMGRFAMGGTFSPPINIGGRAASTGDFNHDSRTDLLVAVGEKLLLYSNNGQAVFAGSPIALPDALRSSGVGQIRTLDYNNDGWTDVLLVGEGGTALALLAGAGPDRFEDVTAAVGLDQVGGPIAGLAAGDLDGDGDEDLILQMRDWAPVLAGGDSEQWSRSAAHALTGEKGGDLAVLERAWQSEREPLPHPDVHRDGSDQRRQSSDPDRRGPALAGRGSDQGDRSLRLLRNDGGERGHWLNVRLQGKKVARDGYGATVEIISGGHYQKQTVSDGWIHFGLGTLNHVDVVRIVWSSGQAQNVVRPSINRTATVEQYVKVSASCGFLYAWNGRCFEFINEILGIGPLGAPMSPGVYFPVDHTELTKIRRDQLAPQEGFYELRLTEELREITYADQITLRVVDHPAKLVIIPNEMFSWPPPEDKFWAPADPRPPVAAVDEGGQDVLALLRAADSRYVTFPRVPQYDGLAVPHSLTLDLGDLSAAEQVLLFLDGWIYWSEASTTMAIDQDPRYSLTPLQLEIPDETGRWRVAVASVGLPTSKGLVVPLDLTGRFAPGDYRVRLTTTMCIYYDHIFVATRDAAERCRATELPVAHAELRYRGFSRMTRDELGCERFDYNDVSPIGSWDSPRGFYTCYGDVTPLLAAPDDRYVIFACGDELALQFDARLLPDLPSGWARDFIFFADGWVKDGDLNTKYSETVGPLPFHGMSGYPYGPTEHYPDTPTHRDYQRRYNTRPAAGTAGSP